MHAKPDSANNNIGGVGQLALPHPIYWISVQRYIDVPIMSHFKQVVCLHTGMFNVKGLPSVSTASMDYELFSALLLNV